MFFISTQPRFIRGVVLPWVISFLKTNLIMLLRKFYVKIHVGVCCSQPCPGDSWEGLHSAAQLLRVHDLPALQTRQRRFSVRTHISHELPEMLRTSARTTESLFTVTWYQDSCRGGAGAYQWGPLPKDIFSSGLDQNMVLQEFDSVYKVAEGKKYYSQMRVCSWMSQFWVWLWGQGPSESDSCQPELIYQARHSVFSPQCT